MTPMTVSKNLCISREIPHVPNGNCEAPTPTEKACPKR